MTAFVQLATVLRGATPFRFGNVNDTFYGQLLIPGGQMRSAIIKDLDQRQLANELMASALAHACGMPTPQAYVAAAAPDVLATTKGPLLHDGRRILFASADAQTPNVAQLYEGADYAAALKVWQRLAGWEGVGDLYGFDAWIANIDRHHRNLLFGPDGQVWLIDHGHCFTGPAWDRAKLDASATYRNRLREWLTLAMDEPRRNVVARKAAALEARIATLDPQQLGASNYVANVLGSEDFVALADFLRSRTPHVPRLAAAALDINLGL